MTIRFNNKLNFEFHWEHINVYCTTLKLVFVEHSIDWDLHQVSSLNCNLKSYFLFNSNYKINYLGLKLRLSIKYQRNRLDESARSFYALYLRMGTAFTTVNRPRLYRRKFQTKLHYLYHVQLHFFYCSSRVLHFFQLQWHREDFRLRCFSNESPGKFQLLIQPVNLQKVCNKR